MSGQGQIETWIAEAQRGDRSALVKLMAAYGPALRARAEALMDPAIKTKTSPDDVLQAVYLDLAQRIHRFEDRGSGSLLHWLNAILDQKLAHAQQAAHRKVRDVGREVPAEQLRADSYGNLLDNLYANSTTPSRVVRREEALSALFTCLADLSEPQRQAVQLRYLEGLSVDEVAAQLGKSKAAVTALTKRALEALRGAMDQLGEFTHGS
jgi:RNA polymerase sigma-70 factor (ECF subfamily)